VCIYIYSFSQASVTGACFPTHPPCTLGSPKYTLQAFFTLVFSTRSDSITGSPEPKIEGGLTNPSLLRARFLFWAHLNPPKIYVPGRLHAIFSYALGFYFGFTPVFPKHTFQAFFTLIFSYALGFYFGLTRAPKINLAGLLHFNLFLRARILLRVGRPPGGLHCVTHHQGLGLGLPDLLFWAHPSPPKIHTRRIYWKYSKDLNCCVIIALGILSDLGLGLGFT